MEHEEIELFAELAVVALLRFFEQPEVLDERFFRGERGAVDALEHRVALVAAPVRAGHAGQLDGRELAGAGHVRPFAEVDPLVARLAVPVER